MLSKNGKKWIPTVLTHIVECWFIDCSERINFSFSFRIESLVLMGIGLRIIEDPNVSDFGRHSAAFSLFAVIDAQMALFH